MICVNNMLLAKTTRNFVLWTFRSRFMISTGKTYLLTRLSSLRDAFVENAFACNIITDWYWYGSVPLSLPHRKIWMCKTAGQYLVNGESCDMRRQALIWLSRGTLLGRHMKVNSLAPERCQWNASSSIDMIVPGYITGTSHESQLIGPREMSMEF